MTNKTHDDAIAEIKSIAESVGFEIVSMDTDYDIVFGPASATIDIMVVMPGEARTEFDKMKQMEREISTKYGGDCRTGLYYAAIGYPEIPAGQALIQIDCLPFDIDFETKPSSSFAP